VWRAARIRQLLSALTLAVLVVVDGVSGAAPARADTDTDFATQLHGYGIYGQRDYNAWLGKITCERLATRLDANAIDSAKFLSANLPRGTTTEQTWQFLSAALATYCPEQLSVLSAAASQH
jgi:hypothetical protein